MKKLFTTLLAASMMLAGTTVFAQNLCLEAGFGLSSTKFDLPLINDKTADLYGGDVPVDTSLLSIQNYYESMWLARGLNIRYIKFQLPHKGQLEEPDVEIPMDEYRSYKRDKRSPKETSK